jgi:hypothetical protein
MRAIVLSSDLGAPPPAHTSARAGYSGRPSPWTFGPGIGADVPVVPPAGETKSYSKIALAAIVVYAIARHRRRA